MGVLKTVGISFVGLFGVAVIVAVIVAKRRAEESTQTAIPNATAPSAR
jgi:hypothetical protein